MPRAPLETPRWGVSWILWDSNRARPRNAPVGRFCTKQHLMGCCSFFFAWILWSSKRAQFRTARAPRPRNAPPGRFCPAGRKARGTGCSNPLFYCTKSSTLWGAALFVLHGFYGAVKSGFEQPVPRALETPRWGVSRGRNPNRPSSAPSSTLWGAALLFCMDFMEQ